MENSKPLAQVRERINKSRKSGNLEVARRQLTDALDRWPDDVALRAETGAIFEAAAEFTQAEAFYRELVAAFPSHPLPGSRLVRLLVHQHRLAEARDIYETVVWTSRLPTEMKSKYLDSLVGMESGEAEEVGAFVERLIAGALAHEPLVARVTALRNVLKWGIGAATDKMAMKARREIQDALKSGDVRAANARLVAALERKEGNIALRVEEGAILEAEGKHPLAEHLYRELVTAFPIHPLAYQRLVRLLAKQGRGDEAQELFASAIWSSRAVQIDVKVKLLDQVVRAGSADADDFADFLDRLLARDSSDKAFVRYASALRRALEGRPEDALATFRAPEELEYGLTLVRDFLLRSGRNTEAQAVAQALIERYPDNFRHIRRFTLLLAYSGQTDALVKELAGGLRRWPGDTALLRRLNHSFLPRAALAELFKIAQAGRSASKMDVKALVEYATAALHADDNEAAHAALDEINAGPAMDYLVAPLRAALTRWPRGWRPTARFNDDTCKSAQVVRKAGAVATLVVFTGFVRGISHLPLAYADSLLAAYPANIIYLRDTEFTGYFRGIPELGKDLSASVARLRQIVIELGVPAITLGASLGGFAAVRFGTLIGAQTAISLSGPTRLRIRRKIQGGANALFSSLSERDKDLVPDIVDHPGLRLIYHYGGNNPVDAAEAQRLRGLANCDVRPVEGVNDHNVVLHMIGRGDFERLLSRDAGLSH